MLNINPSKSSLKSLLFLITFGSLFIFVVELSVCAEVRQAPMKKKKYILCSRHVEHEKQKYGSRFWQGTQGLYAAVLTFHFVGVWHMCDISVAACNLHIKELWLLTFHKQERALGQPQERKNKRSRAFTYVSWMPGDELLTRIININKILLSLLDWLFRPEVRQG